MDIEMLAPRSCEIVELIIISVLVAHYCVPCLRMISMHLSTLVETKTIKMKIKIKIKIKIPVEAHCFSH